MNVIKIFDARTSGTANKAHWTGIRFSSLCGDEWKHMAIIRQWNQVQPHKHCCSWTLLLLLAVSWLYRNELRRIASAHQKTDRTLWLQLADQGIELLGVGHIGVIDAQDQVAGSNSGTGRCSLSDLNEHTIFHS